MRLNRTSIMWLFVGNNLLAFLCSYLLTPSSFFSDLEMFWQLPLAITVISVIFFVLSRIAEVAINKKSKSIAVYFWGQVPVALVILGFYYSTMIGREEPGSAENAEYNRDFVMDKTGNTSNDTIQYRALQQLENAYENKNDLRIRYYSMSKYDTVINGEPDSVANVYFTYTVQQEPGTTKVSKHLIGSDFEKMQFYNFSVTEAARADSGFAKSMQQLKAILEEQ